jgi:hypothetical protein
MAHDDSKPAFARPVSYLPGGPVSGSQGGMTLREWYAGLAMQAVATASGGEFTPGHDARIAVRYADALLSVLAEPTP